MVVKMMLLQFDFASMIPAKHSNTIAFVLSDQVLTTLKIANHNSIMKMCLTSHTPTHGLREPQGIQQPFCPHYSLAQLFRLLRGEGK